MNEPVQRTEALPGWDWTYHAFRESIVWDVEKAGNDWKGILPSEDNPRKRALLEGLR